MPMTQIYTEPRCEKGRGIACVFMLFPPDALAAPGPEALPVGLLVQPWLKPQHSNLGLSVPRRTGIDTSGCPPQVTCLHQSFAMGVVLPPRCVVAARTLSRAPKHPQLHPGQQYSGAPTSVCREFVMRAPPL